MESSSQSGDNLIDLGDSLSKLGNSLVQNSGDSSDNWGNSEWAGSWFNWGNIIFFWSSGSWGNNSFGDVMTVTRLSTSNQISWSQSDKKFSAVVVFWGSFKGMFASGDSLSNGSKSGVILGTGLGDF